MNESLRDKIIQEIILTEKTYLQQLHTLDKFFAKPLLEKDFFPIHVHSAIFGELASLQHMNNELYHALTSEEGDVGRAFLHLAPFLKVYSSYAKNYQQAMNLILDWERKSEKFRTWLTGTESRPEVQSKLPSLLITPVQRVPRYRLLLAELLKHTAKDHPQYDSIAKAEEEVGHVAEHIDRSISKSESLQRVLVIQRALKNGQPNIISPGRHLLKEGVLQKVSRSGNSYQARLFFLFSDVLLYTKPPAICLSSSSNSISEALDMDYKPRSLEYCCLLPLRHCSVTCVFGSGQQNLFRLKCESEDMLLFSSDKAGEWVAALKEAIHQAVRNRRTLRKESSSRKPIRRPALRKLTVRGDPEQLIALKVQKPQDENQNSNAARTSEESPRTAKETAPKSQWSPGAFFSQLMQVQDCLTPPWLSPSKRRKAARESSSDEDVKGKLKSPHANPSGIPPRESPAKSAKRCKSVALSALEGNHHKISESSASTPRRACPYPPRYRPQYKPSPLARR
ncbi:FYVE, RhoGEF and PH domain-containing protein 3-like [Penaeus indicus]|uniref:FYVE, RhoGEF and PH domain-containing protein 3-like n=1 Tax=Penaeus indicus TaxID=29960 RepID=UPI00300D7FEC